jgi:hypothetical protein
MAKKIEFSWGDYAVVDVVTHNLEKKPDLWFRFKPLTTKGDVRLQQALRKKTKVTDDRVLYPLPLEVAVWEIAVCYDGSNIPFAILEEGEEGVSIRHEEAPNPNIGLETIVDYIESFPVSVVDELWRALGETNPTLGPRERSRASSPEESQESTEKS